MEAQVDLKSSMIGRVCSSAIMILVLTIVYQAASVPVRAADPFENLPPEQRAAAIELLNQGSIETGTNPLELIRLGLERAKEERQVRMLRESLNSNHAHDSIQESDSGDRIQPRSLRQVESTHPDDKNSTIQASHVEQTSTESQQGTNSSSVAPTTQQAQLPTTLSIINGLDVTKQPSTVGPLSTQEFDDVTKQPSTVEPSSALDLDIVKKQSSTVRPLSTQEFDHRPHTLTDGNVEIISSSPMPSIPTSTQSVSHDLEPVDRAPTFTTTRKPMLTTNHDDHDEDNDDQSTFQRPMQVPSSSMQDSFHNSEFPPVLSKMNDHPIGPLRTQMFEEHPSTVARSTIEQEESMHPTSPMVDEPFTSPVFEKIQHVLPTTNAPHTDHYSTDSQHSTQHIPAPSDQRDQSQDFHHEVYNRPSFSEHEYEREHHPSKPQTQYPDSPKNEEFEDEYVDTSDPNNPKRVHIKKKVQSRVDPDGVSHEQHESMTSSSLGNDPNNYSHSSSSSSSSYSSSSSGLSSPDSHRGNNKPTRNRNSHHNNNRNKNNHNNWMYNPQLRNHMTSIPPMPVIPTLRPIPMMPTMFPMNMMPYGGGWDNYYLGHDYDDYGLGYPQMAAAGAYAGYPTQSPYGYGRLDDGYTQKRPSKKRKRAARKVRNNNKFNDYN